MVGVYQQITSLISRVEHDLSVSQLWWKHSPPLPSAVQIVTSALSLPGGLLICLPREQAARFCAEIKSPKYGEGHQAWIIGIVEKGNRTARIIDKPRIIEVAPQIATQNVNPTPGATS